jgi:hypothetical protein
VSFEIQELSDVIRVIVLLRIRSGTPVRKTLLKDRIDRRYARFVRVEDRDLDKALEDLASERLITMDGEIIQLTEQGSRLAGQWRSLLLKREPVLEVIAGLTDGSITALVVIHLHGPFDSPHGYLRGVADYVGSCHNEFFQFSTWRHDR